MDNSIKLLIGVIGLAGLIAFVVPSGAPAPGPVDPSVPEAVGSPQILGLDPSLEAGRSVAPPAQVEYFKFGEPTIDGKPFGSVDEPKPIERSRDQVEPPVLANPQPPYDLQNALTGPPPADPAIPAN